MLESLLPQFRFVLFTRFLVLMNAPFRLVWVRINRVLVHVKSHLEIVLQYKVLLLTFVNLRLQPVHRYHRSLIGQFVFLSKCVLFVLFLSDSLLKLG